jgi:UDP-N-acetylmuramoyl-L-alanyl-D-glutamate--2,6-diaminopimelate ligase
VLLSHLLAAVPHRVPGLAADRPVTGVTHDSRRVQPGMVFVAIAGFTVDGHEFVADACARGAAAVVVEGGRIPRPQAWPEEACAWVEVDDTRAALSALAAAWHGYPGRDLTVVGVTGTDGKTTTVHMTAAVLEAGLGPTGLLSTARWKVGGRWQENPTRQTTLEAPDVQALLAQMREGGARAAVMEASSHGLALAKLDHCFFDVAVFTNIAEDHLDFHGTRAAYWAAKARLLDLVAAGGKPGPRFAVLNADDASYAYLTARTSLPLISYALERPADLQARILAATAAGTRARLSGRWGAAELWLPMPGPFNLANALAALAVGLGLGVSLADACAALAAFAGVPGRMVPVRRGQPFDVIIDYAHTGPAFRKLLAVLRPLTAGRIIAVFGSAGEQSHERREGMGAAAAELVDFTVLTSEDPRSEDPERIIDDIARAMRARGRVEGRDFIRVPDRRAAIRAAFARARPGDLVVLTGKGHERSIIVGRERVPWDEQRVAEEELAGFMAGRAGGGSGAD